jgi:HK97 family phage major capsid protein
LNKRERIAKINERLTEIEQSLDNANMEQVDAFDEESKALVEERSKLSIEIKDEVKRNFNQASRFDLHDDDIKGDVLTKRGLSIAFAKAVRGDKLTDVEARALGVANTTTSTTFVEPSVDQDGVNNAGIFIPEQVLLDILKETELISSFAQDCVISHLKGVIKFPYKVSNTKPIAKAELSANEDASFRWAILELDIYNQTISVNLTYEIEALAIEQFTGYLLAEISQAIREATSEEFLYGTGLDDHLTGATVGAAQAVTGGYKKGEELAAIEAGIKALPKRKRAGAKIYIASDLYKTILFAKDTNGNYLYNPFNSNGINKFGPLPLVEDEILHDGDFLIGNAKYQKLNLVKGVTVERERKSKERIVEYNCHCMIAGKPVPSSFVYGYVKSTT